MVLLLVVLGGVLLGIFYTGIYTLLLASAKEPENSEHFDG